MDLRFKNLNFVQNRFPEQAKVVESGSDYIKWAAEVKR